MTLVSCSASSSRHKRGRFEVTVVEDGKTVSDTSKQLVHRMVISKSNLKSSFGATPEEMQALLNINAQLDAYQRVAGLEVLGRSPSSETASKQAGNLGLQYGDMVTAVGKNRVIDPVDFWGVYEALKIEKKATITLQRRGDAHKILYFLKQ